jgi:hypothetical protein
MSLQIQLKKSAVSQKQPFASDLAVGELALNYNADGPFLTCKDTAGNVRKLNHVWVGATAPTSPSAGDQWLDTSAATAVLKVYKDSSSTWVNATTIPIATTSVYGTVRLATAADVTNGTSGKIVDAAQLQSKITSAFAQEEITLNDVNLLGDMVIAGDLTVNGTTTTIDTETLIVEDKNIEMGSVDTPTDTTADGGGITLKGTTDKTINWVNATDAWTSSERFSYPLGTAAAPTITFTGDPNTGIYSPDADEVAISTNGTGRLFVDSSGNVGIGTPPSSLLQLQSDSDSSQELYLRNSNTGTSASSALSVNTSTATFLLRAHSATHSVWPDTAVVSAGSGFSNGLVLSTGTTSPIRFFTNNSERMRLDSSGRLGLGTSSPDVNLHVNSSGNTIAKISSSFSNSTTTGLRIDTTGDSSTPRIDFQKAGVSRGVIRFAHNATSSNEQFSFNIGGGTDKLVITGAGNVGIGTTSPAQLLHLNSPSANATQWIAAGTGYTSNLSLLANGSGGGLVLSSLTDSSASVTNTLNAALTLGTNNAERARIDSAGKLLVGTSTSVTNGQGDASLQITTNSSNYYAADFGHFSNDAFTGAVYFKKTRSTTAGGFASVAANDVLGDIRFAGADGATYIRAAAIECRVDGTPGANDMPGRLVFSTTADGASTPTERMRITNSGAILLGCTTAPNPGAASTANGWAVNGTNTAAYVTAKNDNGPVGYFRRDGTDGSVFVFYKGNATVGNISVTASATAYNTSSDYRLKENVVPLTGAVDRVNQLQVRRFNFIADPDTTVDGFIAHEAQAVVPEAVTGTHDEVDDEGNPVYQGIDQSKLVPLLTAALQEALGRIETLEQRLNDAGIA